MSWAIRVDTGKHPDDWLASYDERGPRVTFDTFPGRSKYATRDAAEAIIAMLIQRGVVDPTSNPLVVEET